MSTKHLWWIIPVSVVIGFVIGYFMGIWNLIVYVETDAGLQKLCSIVMSK